MTTAPLSDDAQAILEGMSDAFYALDGEWRIIYANRRALAFWRVTAADVIGHVIWQRFPSMVGTLNEQVLRQVRAEQRVITFEAPSPTMGIWVAVSVGPSGDGVSVYWRDISDRVEAENALRSFAEKLERQVADRTRALSEAVEELRQSRARYSAIFENSPVDLVFLAVRPDGRIVCEDANPAWERHSGYPRAFMVGKTPEEVLPPGQVEYAMKHYRRAIETKQPVEYEYTVQFPIGEVSRRSFLVPLLGDTGEVEHVLLTAVDLTEMRRVEAQLRQAQKMEAIGQLTGGIAHDFNNLLTAVIGNLELLQTRVTDARSSGMVDAALRSAVRGGQLTQQLLAHARKQNLRPRPVDVNAAINGMSDLLQRSLGGLVQVETDLADDLWPAISDPAQLELVVLNLAINARDAMPDGGGLRIATNNVSQSEVPRLDELEPGDYVRIAVTDSGVGMSREVQERAFEPFFTTKEIGKGSGLGLAQVYGVVKQFGGTVRLASTPGAGTTVDVFLPRALSPASDAASANHMIADAPDGHGTILVVDDDEDVREIAATFLREAGYAVREAGSGPDATGILAEGPVNLALVDYAMPMMSGLEFARVAREIQPDLPIVYITGAINMLGTDGQALGDPVVVKPYSRATLLKMVRETALPS
ncbi:MAG TPA: PAS domain-containing protein [Acetobacteraceae bacterium]|nr:PAS domain-containing protein [Acetobacteraceae bacterium]